jgi:DNA invertase Pin-like site-specific DNA recombinase
MVRQRNAIGIVRVSQVGDRAGASFASPKEQRERIEAACKRDGLQLVEVLNELDVSGGTPLERRDGLRSAIEAVEQGKASVVIAAYFDRLVRSLDVQRELVSRVEAAGGEVLAVDVGQVTHGSATKKLSGTLLGAFAEYQRDTARERSGDAQRRAVERGVVPYPNVPPGYRRGEDGVLVPHPEAKFVAEAFRMRAEGKRVKDVRAYLVANGIARSYHGVSSLLASRVVLGEIRFGNLVNLKAHPPIVDHDTFRKVQAMAIPRGPKPKSERLLARQGVLVCGSCGSRMVIGTAKTHYYSYRCPPTGDCTERMAISADIAEQVVTERVRVALADVEGCASAEANVREAEQELENAEQALRGAVAMLSGLEDVSGTRERLLSLREARDEGQARLDRIGGSGVAVTISADADWDRLTLDEQRALIRATVERATVAPGRGADRIAVKLFAE